MVGAGDQAVTNGSAVVGCPRSCECSDGAFALATDTSHLCDVARMSSLVGDQSCVAAFVAILQAHRCAGNRVVFSSPEALAEEMINPAGEIFAVCAGLEEAVVREGIESQLWDPIDTPPHGVSAVDRTVVAAALTRACTELVAVVSSDEALVDWVRALSASYSDRDINFWADTSTDFFAFMCQCGGLTPDIVSAWAEQELDRLQTYLNPDEGYLWQHKHNQLRATLHIAESVALRMSSG